MGARRWSSGEILNIRPLKQRTFARESQEGNCRKMENGRPADELQFPRSQTELGNEEYEEREEMSLLTFLATVSKQFLDRVGALVHHADRPADRGLIVLRVVDAQDLADRGQE